MMESNSPKCEHRNNNYVIGVGESGRNVTDVICSGSIGEGRGIGWSTISSSILGVIPIMMETPNIFLSSVDSSNGIENAAIAAASMDQYPFICVNNGNFAPSFGGSGGQCYDCNLWGVLEVTADHDHMLLILSTSRPIV